VERKHIEHWGQRVLMAHERIRSSILETPLELVRDLYPKLSARVFFKLENQQRTGSFKLRGATNKVLSLTAQQAQGGVIAASNGNHGLGVATAAKINGVPAEIYVSTRMSSSKIKRIEECGAHIRQAGDNPLEAELAGRAAALASGKVFISPYNDVDVIAGQGTIGVELQNQLPNSDAIFVAVGGGGLIGGIGAYLKWVSPRTEIVGCWPENSPVLYQCMKAGRIIDVPEQPTLSESTAGGLEPGSVTLDLCKNVIDRSILVSEQEILDALRQMRESKGWLIEGAAAVAWASFLQQANQYQGKTVVIIICGGNVSPEVLQRLQ
jgi:threonine dehydratase